MISNPRWHVLLPAANVFDRIDVEIARRTVEPFRARVQQVLRSHIARFGFSQSLATCPARRGKTQPDIAGSKIITQM